jgi:hypothetical protein
MVIRFRIYYIYSLCNYFLKQLKYCINVLVRMCCIDVMGCSHAWAAAH